MLSAYADRLSVRIRDRMFELEFTQTELANRVGCRKGLVGNWVNGYSLPSIKYIKPLCKALKVSPNWLLEIDEVY